MGKNFQKVVAMLLGIVSIGWIGGVDTAKAASLAFLHDASVQSLDPLINDTGNTMTFTWKSPAASTTIGRFKVEAFTDPNSTTHPTTAIFNATGAEDGTAGNGDWTGGFTTGTWTGAKSSDFIYILTANAPQSYSADSIFGFKLKNVKNPSTAALNPGDCPSMSTDVNNSEGTCYLHITAYSDIAGVTPVAEANISFTVTTGVQVSARIESQLNFWVAPVAAGQNIANYGVANTTQYAEGSAYNELDFKTITASSSAAQTDYGTTNRAKFMAQDLYVKTNASKGYVVTAALKGTTNPANAQLDGVYGNVIAGSSAANNWATPAAFATAWTNKPASSHAMFVANSNDTDLTSGNGMGAGIDKWGDLKTVADGGSEVSKSSIPDAGATPVRVSYGLIADVNQPADQYTGTIVYNCVGKY